MFSCSHEQLLIGVHSSFTAIKKRTPSFYEDNYCLCKSVKMQNLGYWSLDQGRTKHSIIIYSFETQTTDLYFCTVWGILIHLWMEVCVGWTSMNLSLRVMDFRLSVFKWFKQCQLNSSVLMKDIFNEFSKQVCLVKSYVVPTF